ncbi:hypothetical protein GT002_33880, partial [Streptomyces sp. SID4917]
RLIYQSRLQARFGRNWRRKAPIEALMPLRLAKYGVPLAPTTVEQTASPTPPGTATPSGTQTLPWATAAGQDIETAPARHSDDVPDPPPSSAAHPSPRPLAGQNQTRGERGQRTIRQRPVGEDAQRHRQAIAAAASNAAAVRYAINTLSSTHTATVVGWLAEHGRKVNRGQAHRITEKEAERRDAARQHNDLPGAGLGHDRDEDGRTPRHIVDGRAQSERPTDPRRA